MVYLIAADGGSASYLLPVSLLGGVILMGLATRLLLLLYGMSRHRIRTDG
ncbi:MAG: hypothetical protein ACYSUI_00420 [Planctomycetota bacterium]